MSVNPSLLARRAASVNVSTDDSAEVGPLSSINKRAAASGSRPAAASASVNCSDSVATPRHHDSWSSPPLPVVIQPWPNRAASASDRGPLAASANGTRGCCTLPGRFRAAFTVYDFPRQPNVFVVRSPTPTSTHSDYVRSESVITYTGLTSASP